MRPGRFIGGGGMKTIINSVHRLLGTIEAWAALVAGLIVLLIMSLGVWEVVGRSLFSHPLHGYLDMVEQLMVGVALLGMPYCQARLGNVRMSLLVGRLTGRLRWIMETIAFLAALAVVAVLIKGSWLHFLRAYSIGGSSAEIQLPIWVASLIVPVVLTMLAIRLALQLLEGMRLIVSPDDDTAVVDYNDHVPHAADDPAIEGPERVE